MRVFKWFGMAAVNNQLVLVGGRVISNGKKTNMLSMWDELSQRWTRPFPEMPTPRHSPSAISYQKWLWHSMQDKNIKTQ